MASNATSSAFKGAAIGTALFPGVGTTVGGLIGLSIGFGKDAEDEQDRARAEVERIQLESQKFQASARAQRLSLLQTGRRFSDNSTSQSSALSSAIEQPSQSSALSASSSESGTSSAGTF